MAEIEIAQRLMLCCRLGQTVQPLSSQEFYAFSQVLRLFPDVPLSWESLGALGYGSEHRRRVLRLLDREDRLMDYVNAAPEIIPLWQGHEQYPHYLERMQEETPPVLFCQGDPDLLQLPAIAVVGSREPAAENAAFACAMGERIAREGFALVSGNARGIDTLAQEACLAAGGKVIAFVPDDLREHPQRKNVLYVSDEGYDCFFTAQRALRRNHYIHALGRLCFVAQCAKTAGGTWQGATDNLRHGRSPLYIFDDGSEGCKALQRQGARPLSEPPEELRPLLLD